ncbi:hypothetical protein [Teredinibacter sp. KSP-S5-2]|uniref:hypothetical protein n=1 Tax=Teredinibacter sp. KSP-S5-2 TaxID=3034506 RepID=UPI0029350246|nr:hypothetical protein [Teredinibacter sp. KSP-S5-2]WNO11122.1 hypothetical protein P5V12_08050 [Teredinibacter sp. KSP-S5-2]
MISVITNKYPNLGENIIEFVANENTISLGMRIVPIEFPETSPLNLTLNISLDDGRVFEFSTGNIEFDFGTTSMQ